MTNYWVQIAENNAKGIADALGIKEIPKNEKAARELYLAYLEKIDVYTA